MENNYFKEFLKYVVLNISGLIGISVYILADTFFIARGIGPNGLAALNVAIPGYSLIHGCGLMLGMGGGTKYTINISRREVKKANGIFTLTLILGAVIACIFVLAGIFFSKKLAVLLGADEDILEMTVTYLRVLLLFAPAFIFNNILICFIRNVSMPGTAMLAMIAGSITNIIFDYIFIFPMELGIFGAVIATGFSPLVSILIMLTGYLKRGSGLGLFMGNTDLKNVASVLGIGVPSFISEAAGGVVIFVFNFIIFGLKGNIGIAAYGITANISMVISSLFTGIGEGIQPLVSREYGCCNRQAIKMLLFYAVAALTIVAIVVYFCLFAFSYNIVNIFNNSGNTELEKTAVLALRLYFSAILFMGFNIVITLYFSAMERQSIAQIISLMRGLVVIIPCAFLMASTWREWGLWLSFTVTEGITAAAACIFGKQKRLL